jgi:hypothetical protein
MTMKSMRKWLMIIWFAVLSFYMVTLILLPKFRPEIDPHDAMEAIWRTGYILFPILAAFASFMYGPAVAGESNDDAKLDPQLVLITFLCTGVGHGLVVLYFLAHVVTAEFSFSDRSIDTFSGYVSEWHRFLALASMVAVAPVGYALKRPDLKSIASFGEGSERTPRPRTRKPKTPTTIPSVTPDDGQSPAAASHTAQPSA